MLERYLFRGKRLDNGEWVQGGYYAHLKIQHSPVGSKIKDRDISHLIIKGDSAEWNMPRGIDGIEVEPATVGQCTGLRDRNDTLIYECDIIRFEDGDIHTVSYNKEYAAFVFEEGDN